jgi:DNA-binding MarR family transcriptional regulator
MMTNNTFTSTDSVEESADGPADFPTAAVTLLRGIELLRAKIASSERIGTTELRALARLSEGGALTPKQLAAALGLTTGAVTALTDRLVDSDLLSRAPHPTDRRSLTLTLTPAGETVMRRINVDFRQAIMAAAANATPGQTEELARVLQETAGRMIEMATAEADL